MDEYPHTRIPGAVIVDPYYRNGARPASRLHQFLREYPSAIVLAAVTVDPDTAGDLCTLGEWGIAGIISLATDTTPFKIANRISVAQQRSAIHTVLFRLPDTIAGRTRTIIETALLVAARGERPPELAGDMFLSLRTLQRRTARAGLPAPRRLLAWMRLLLAARYLDDPGRSILSAALAAGYTSDSTLHRTFRRLGMPSPGTARQNSALNLGISKFLAELKGPNYDRTRSILR